MSDINPDVVPQESVVDYPSEYEAQPEAPEAEEKPSADDARPEGAEDDEEPVSLDEPEADPEDAEPEEGESDDGEAEEDAEEDDLVEFDFGGNKLEVKKGDIPPELAEKIDEFSKDIWADYTKKSQANAETAKMLKSRAESLEKIETLSGETLDAFTRGKSIKTEIEQLSAVNMQALWQSDPDRARMLSDTLAAKQAELQGIIATVDQYESQLVQARQDELARRSEEGRQVLDRKYKGFSEQIAPKLEEYAIKNGIPAEEAKTWHLNPVVADFAYKAMLYDQMQAAKTPKATPKTAKPVRSMKNKGGNRQPINQNDMSFEDLGKVLGIK